MNSRPGAVLATGTIDGVDVPSDNILLPLTLETVFVGIYTSLFVTSTYILLRQGFHRRANLVLLIATFTMYTFSTAHWILYLSQARCALKNTCIPFRVHADAVALSATLPVNFVIGDAIIIWRTWLIWQRQPFVFFLTAPLLLACIVCSIINVVQLPGSAFLLPVIVQSFASNWPGFAALCTSLTINLSTTILVAYKAWIHNRELKVLFKQNSSYAAVEEILTTLIECGCIYCIVWILHILADAGVLGLFGVVVSTCTVQITGLYPTIIVILACMRRSHAPSTVLSTFRAASWGAEPSRTESRWRPAALSLPPIPPISAFNHPSSRISPREDDRSFIPDCV